MPVLTGVVTAAEAAALDAETIGRGVPSRALMQRAGAAAATEIDRRIPWAIPRGVLVLAGPGNNGGDAWVVARAFAAAGASVRVVEPAGASTPDCQAERELALPHVELVRWSADRPIYDGEGVVIDGLLGTGSSGPPRGEIAACIRAAENVRARGAAIVALDVPSGLDATTGECTGALSADLTITFGSVKRGHLISRGTCGMVIAVDIGLAPDSSGERPRLLSDAWLRSVAPSMPSDAHKGTRKKLAIVGGDRGMAGAMILAARAAERSGLGMVRAVVHAENAAAVHTAVPSAMVATWDDTLADPTATIASWADALVIGPGLGRSPAADDLLAKVLAAWSGPSVLDADALNAFAGDIDRLGGILRGRRTLITPHPAELARLLGVRVGEVLDSRFEIGKEVSRLLGCAVLLKGVPTVVTLAGRAPLVVAAGTPILATAGSGDLLSGIAGTFMAQIDDPLVAGGAAAMAHGLAGQLGSDVLPFEPESALWFLREPGSNGDPSDRGWLRGKTLDHVLEGLVDMWSMPEPRLRYPTLAELPSVPPR